MTKNLNADLVVRICSDNPFIDPKQIDYLFKKFKTKVLNMLFDTFAKLCNGFGAEIFTFQLH